MGKARRRSGPKSEVEEKRDQLMAEVLDHREFLKGSLVQTQTRCGKANCRCARGERHIVWHLSYKEGGHTRRVYVPKDLVLEVKRWLGNRKEIEERLGKAFELNLQLIREIGAKR